MSDSENNTKPEVAPKTAKPAKPKKPSKPKVDALAKSKAAKGDLPNPVWFKPVMFGFMLLGLAWIVVYYITQTKYPVPNLGAWNMGIGFVFVGIGFSLATRWR